jgi:hypothetical protein
MKQTIEENFRIEVVPESIGGASAVRMHRLCALVAKQIIACVGVLGTVEVRYNKRDICSHCKKTYDLNVFGEPRCCEAERREVLYDPVKLKNYFTTGKERIYRDPKSQYWIRLSQHGKNWTVGTNSGWMLDKFLEFAEVKYGYWVDSQEEAQRTLDKFARIHRLELVTKQQYERRH